MALRKYCFLFVLLIISQKQYAQYTLNNNAFQNACNEYRLTNAVNGQSGSVWNNTKINLTQSFDFNFSVFLGNNNSPGADGMAFVLQPISTSVGTSGGGLGFQGVNPSVGVTLDTYQNGADNDPSFDHIAIQLNGNISHTSINNIAGPVTAINGNDNIEDGIWHSFRVVWDAPTKTYTAYIDGVLRVTTVKDFVADVFAGDPLVYWGFTASTGGENNYQAFRTVLAPSYTFSATQKKCVNEPIAFTNTTISFSPIVNVFWNFGDGSPIDQTISPVHTYTVAGDYTVTQRVVALDGCEITNVQTIRIGTKPIAGFSNDNNCNLGAVNFTDTSSTVVGTINNWFWDFDNAGSTSTQQHPSTTYPFAGPKTIKLAVKSLEGCVSDTLVKTIQVYNAPSAPTVLTTTIAYCQNATAVALTATGTNLLWYTTATGGVGSSTAPTPITTATGTTTYYVSQTLNGCESVRTPVVINVTATPAAPIVTSTVGYCQGITATALTATGTNLMWYTTATGGTGSTTAPTPLTTGLGSANYYVSQSTNGCEGPRALIMVTVSPTPAAPIVNPTITYCQGTAGNQLTAVGTNLLWYTTASGGTGATNAPLPSTATIGSSIYYVSQSALGGCEGPRASITVTINQTPLEPIVTTFVGFCQGSTATALTATGTNLLWYSTFSGIGSPIAPIPSTTTISFSTYYVTQTLGVCEGPKAPIYVSIKAIPTAPIVTTPVTYCQGETATAVPGTGITTNWYTVPFGGQPSGPNNPLIPSTVSTGNTLYYISYTALYAFNNTPQTFLFCEGPRTTLVVTVNPTPGLPTVTTPVAYCQNAPTVPLIASGINLQWYTTATGGTASTVAPTVSSATAGIFTYYVAQKLGNCEGPRAAIDVNITATPTAPIVVTPINICPNDIAQPLTATGTNLLWYTAAIGGVGTSIAPTPNTTVFPAIYNFYVSQSIGSCESQRALLTVTIDNPVSVNVGLDSTICEGQSVKILPVVTPAGAAYEWRAIGVPLSTIDDRFIKDATVNPIDTGMYILKATLGGCSKEDTLNVNVIWKPIINAGLTKAICLDSSILLKGIVSHNSSDSISYLWSPTDSLATPDALQTLAYPTKTTLYTISFQTKPTYGCDFKGSSSVKLVVQKIDKAFAGNDTIAVKGVPHLLTGSGGLNYTWSSPTGINISNPFSQKAFVTLNDDAQFYLKVTDAIGCEGRDTIFIKVYNGPTYYVPNAFTPNADGVNDIFRAIPVGMANTYFRIFNRRGQVMFETSQYLKGWDGTFNGKPQPNGTYVWIVTGTDRDYKKVEMKGTVNLIR
jgi:gliding motility-associated-like protein